MSARSLFLRLEALKSIPIALGVLSQRPGGEAEVPFPCRSRMLFSSHAL